MTLFLAPTIPNDYEALSRMCTHYFGEDCVGIETYETFLDFIQFPFSCWTLKQEERIVGGFSIFRLSDTRIEELLACRLQENEITLHDILALEQSIPLKIYLAVGAVDDRLPDSLRFYYGGRLMAGFASVLLTLREQSYLIEEIYGLAASEEGKRATSKLGFKPLFLPSCPATFTPIRLLMTQQRMQQFHRLRNIAPPLRIPASDYFLS